MTRHPAHPRSSPLEDTPFRRAPLKSVSTRIVLCVFASTLLTALIVSWLSVGAIHQDVRSHVSDRTAALVQARAEAIAGWRREIRDRLKDATTPGAEWHRRLLASFDAQHGAANFLWASARHRGAPPEPEDDSRLGLPVPPAALADGLERLTFRPASPLDGLDAMPVGCVPVGREIRRSPDGDAIGRLEACLDHDRLLELLEPSRHDRRALRVMLTDDAGQVLAGTGAHADERLSARLPLDRLRARSGDELASYTDDTGRKLIGGLAAVDDAPWFVVAEAEYADAFAPAIAITNQIFIVDVCIIFLFSVVAYKITLAIMQPIEALSEGAQRIAAGQIDHQIPMPANDDDELGLLTRTFNEMMRKLRSNQLEIEDDRLRLAEKNEELQRANEILAQLSITDGLTKLHNHRYFQDHLTREIKRVSRTDAPLSMILIDLDDFKQLNDTHGHAAGDEVLVALAAIMNDSARESDLIARYGGEEFVILLPNTDLAGAVHLAEKVRMAVESTRLIIGDSMKPVEVTISLGVAVFHGDRRAFFAEADRALYQAKASGKNCVIIAGSGAAPAPGAPPARPT